jgi:dipeptidyl aminopeptidase/acylaminoacyl peptidase
MGGADLEDVMAAIRLAAHAPGVDARSVYLYGESRGGMMALQAIRDRAAVRAAATVGAFTDLDTLFRDDPRSAGMAEKIWPDYREHSEAIAERRSALRWADRLHVPLLILQGREDGQVRVWHGERLAAALLARRTPCELHIIEGAGHTIGEHSMERDSMIVAWFLEHRR